MEEIMDDHEDEGVIMTVDVKIPIVGTTSSRTYSLGNKMKAETTVMGETLVFWTDGETSWTYNPKENKISINKSDQKKENEASGDAEMFSNITEGYDISIEEETDEAWYIKCKKAKLNKEKDAPKNMDLVISKGSFFPLSLTVKMSGVKMTMKDISFGVTEKEVSFNADEFPEAEIEDKR